MYLMNRAAFIFNWSHHPSFGRRHQNITQKFDKKPKQNVRHNITFYWAMCGLFSVIFVFSTNVDFRKNCQWLYSNRSHLVLEVTALPTVPQSLSNRKIITRYLKFVFIEEARTIVYQTISVTRLVDILYFGQLFKAQGNNYFAQITNTF